MSNTLPRHKFVGVKVGSIVNGVYESHWLSDVSELDKVRHINKFDCFKTAVEQYFEEPSEWFKIRFEDTEVIGNQVKKHEYDYMCYRAHQTNI